VAGESADIVRDEGVGIVFEPENTAALVQHLRLLQQDRSTYERYRAQCLEAAKKYDRTAMAKKMLGVLMQLGR
jgi:glycosyltransferase involved in cell wall biosynthesis